MDIFIKILGLLIGLFFFLIGFRIVFRTRDIIRGIQKFRFKRTAPPRKSEIVVGRIAGSLLALAGIYYMGVVIVSFL